MPRANLATLPLVVVAALGQVAHAQSASDPTVVLMSSSGGVSRGAYQGGVDWTVAEFLRRQRIPAFREVVLPGRDRRFTLGAATGASSGNINALFSALGWCTESLRSRTSAAPLRYIPPEESLYWRAWVNTGFSQMLPEKLDPRREPALLDRTFLETVQLGVIRDYIDRVRAHECDVPLGITLTRLSPERVPMLGTDATIAVQRVATILNVRSEGDRIEFGAPPREMRHGGVGVLVLLPGLESSDSAGHDRRLRALFDAMIASSSFPVAFAPRRICHDIGGLAEPARRTTAPCPAFSDGGVFDNNPLALAVDLFELSHQRAPSNGKTVLPVAVAYSNPDYYRGDFAEERRKGGLRPDARGVGAIVQMLGGAIPAAREYELQNLLRVDDRDDLLRAENGGLKGAADITLMLASRSGPIIGEHLLGFGAFLGRAFREYDFHLGIYDGLRFVARDLLCEGPDFPADRACARRELDRLLRENAYQFDWLTDTVLHWHQRAEFGGREMTPVRVPRVHPGMPIDSLRLTLLAGIFNALLPLRTGPLDQRCSYPNDPMRASICGTRFDGVLQSLGRDDDVLAAARLLRDWCARDAQREARRLGDCTSDDDFVALLEDYRRHLHVLTERALRNLDDAERRIKAMKQGDKDYTWLTELALAHYRASSFRYRRGIHGSRIEINPSSARFEGGGTARVLGSVVLGVLMPNYLLALGGGLPLGDLDHTVREDRVRSLALTWGWRPIVIRLAQPYYLALPVEHSTYAVNVSPEDRRHDVAFGVSAGSHAPGLPLATSIEGGVLWSRHLFTLEPDRPLPRRPIVQLGVRLFAEKLQFSTRFHPALGWTMGVGVADLNGMLYWIAR